MKILKESKVPKRDNGGELRKYFFFPDFDDFEIVVTEMPSMSTQPMHGHKVVNEAHYVISGTIEVTEENTVESLTSGDAVLLEPGKLHTISNSRDEQATILTVKKPRAVDKFISKNMMNEDVSEENLRMFLEQNWLHARHVENERLHFINTYAIVLAALIGLVGIKGMVLSWPVVMMSVFIVFLSVLGIISTYKLSAEFHNHIENIENIVKRLKAREYMGLPLDRSQKGKWKFLRFTMAIYLLFIIVSLLGVGLIIYFVITKI